MNEIFMPMSFRVLEYIVSTNNLDDSLTFLNLFDLQKAAMQTVYLELCLLLVKSDHPESDKYFQYVTSKWDLLYLNSSLSVHFFEEKNLDKSDLYFMREISILDSMESSLEKDYAIEATCDFCCRTNRHNLLLSLCNQIEEINLRISVISRYIDPDILKGEKIDITALSKYIDPKTIQNYLNKHS
ncbi:hypothetical protein [Armatimonas rosea]|uniref:Uncharacterized protein n=1 Tax=Armatimonas rosea TaxID=685828 RepID=A0A7W9STZ0_ARMRO|nr:hypothetical protein [Armatimonas rosea]MBB6052164.1 hypothetical protein [Armatimonas rosea]